MKFDKVKINKYYFEKREYHKNYQIDNSSKIKEIKNAYFRAIKNDNYKRRSYKI